MPCQRAFSCLVVLSWTCFAGVGCTSDNPAETPASSVGVGPGSGGSTSDNATGGNVVTPTGGSPSGGASNTSGGSFDGSEDTSNTSGGSPGAPSGSPSGGTPNAGAGSGDGTGGNSPGAAPDASGGAPAEPGGSPTGDVPNGSGGSPDGTGANPSGGAPNGSAGSTDGAGGNTTSGGDAANPEAPEPFTFGKPPAAAEYFKQGINLGNRLEAPNEGDWGGSVLASDFPFIAQRGFDHVRIPIRFSGHALSGAPYTIDATFFQRIDTLLDQAAAAGLAAIIDLHSYDEMVSDPSAERERFLALWSQIAARYQDRPDTVAFELFNEPNTMLDSVWNDIAAAAINTVRATNPRRLLVVDTVFWADPSKLSLLTLPDDANLLVAVHVYEPKLFSFQGKSWIGEAYMTTGVIFPGPPAAPISPVQAALDADWAAAWFDDYNTKPAAENPSGPATVDAQIAYLTAYQSASGRTVYNGEWGPQDAADMASRVNLVTLVREKCEAEGIGWAIWEDPNNMKLFDSSAGTWVTEIIDALLPP